MIMMTMMTMMTMITMTMMTMRSCLWSYCLLGPLAEEPRLI